MDFNMSDGQKKAALVGVRDTLESEFYSVLIRLGIDPDAFMSKDEIDEANGTFVGERQRARDLFDALERVKEKIADLP